MLIELAVGGALAAAGLALGRAQARENRRAVLRRILERVEGELETAFFADGVRGVHAGRPFRLRLATRTRLGRVPWRRRKAATLLSESYPLELELELLHAPPVQLRIRRDEGLAALEKRLGLARDVEVSGGDSFDQRFLVEAEALPDASALASEEVREVVRRLLGRWELEEVALQKGRLRVRGQPSRVGPLELHALLDAVETLARAFDRRPAPVIHLQPRYEWIGGPDRAARCPYCHERLEETSPASQRVEEAELRLAAETPLIACDRCGTLMHRECFAENHGCPLLGCGGRGWGPAGTPRPAHDKGAAEALEPELAVPPDAEASPPDPAPPDPAPPDLGPPGLVLAADPASAPEPELELPPEE